MGCYFKRLFLALSTLVAFSFACEGNKIKIHYIKNCGDVENNVIKVQENSTVSMTDDCQIIPNSCAETIGFKTAKIHYVVWRNNLPILRNEIDGCEAMTKVNGDIKAMLKLFGLPTKCPVEKMKKCENGSRKAEVMDKYRKLIALGRGGPIKTEVKIDHDNGHSCFTTEFEIMKK